MRHFQTAISGLAQKAPSQTVDQAVELVPKTVTILIYLTRGKHRKAFYRSVSAP